LLGKQGEKHGMRYSKEYISWAGMKRRCYNPRRDGYEYYGGRGIAVCSQWRYSFNQFYADMGPRPEGTSLDRIDNDGNYEPNNCQWATASMQSKNRRRKK